ncbi:CDGSH iron-sulfur domain-containing protein 1 isoform X1 [Misgurnus anguillicaudatus]|uniref:CDGSH iron-sulfur domain-containing protein 1 isoform X1 n=1 Tax=Misgurnus anguillicaudatus TaxID=75329 RepID=UPI0024361143|nr:CDGSH iron-sulfur domain-containing protein 1 isoform X1 [Misgurnus anguillicaudatus]
MSSHVPGFSALTKPSLIPGFRLSKDRLITIIPVAVAAALSTYLVTRYFSGHSGTKSRVNQTFNKDSPKVVHSFDIEDIGNKVAYCRCWRSKKFPYCDGAHAKHNEETGDNVGPLIIKKRNA